MSKSTDPLLGTDPGRSRAERIARLSAARLYVCTDARQAAGDLREFLHSAYSGGVDIIQLRDRSIDTDDEIASLNMLAAAAAEHDRLFAVNDRADIAALTGADVFHIGQRDLSPAQARRLLGPDVLIGCSTHTPEQAEAALTDPDVDYFCTGPVWETPTKPGREATGLPFVADTAVRTRTAPAADGADRPDGAAARNGTQVGAVSKPWFAIGGIDRQRLPEVLAAGAERVVIVRAVTAAADPQAAAAELRTILPT